MDEPRDFFSGLVIGAVVGAAISMLFAPESGAQVRRRLQQQGSQVSERVRDKVEELATRVQRTAEEESDQGS